MARHQSLGIGSRQVGRRLRMRVAAVTAAVTLGLAACGGDDDDAADSTDVPGTTAVETAASDTTLPSEITGGADTSVPDISVPVTDETETSGTGAPPSDGAGSDTTEAPAGAAAVAASETSDADGDASGARNRDASDGSADAGPTTTTGPECEFEENSSLPLERCDMGPPVVVVQLRLQAEGYAIDTVDGEFGDQTLDAVRAFQEDEGLKVDGVVGLQTWTALDVSQFGTDEDGSGVIEPGEIELPG